MRTQYRVQAGAFGFCFVGLLTLGCLFTTFARAEAALDLTHATIVTRGQFAPLPERTAVTVLVQEVQKRSGVAWTTGTHWPKSGWAIALTSGRRTQLHGKKIPRDAIIRKAEGYGLFTDTSAPSQPVLWIVGADPRGALFGVGRFLREAECRPGSVCLSAPLDFTTSPQYPIRGHQLGYRATANSYDAWSPAQFEQYIRELTFFGTNSIEGIPFQDHRPTVNSYPRVQMNVDISRICQKYGLDFWIWTPVEFSLKDTAKRAAMLRKHAAFFRACPRLNDVFFPGGDPGNNPPELVIPYIRDMARILLKYHPKAKMWLSLQGFNKAQANKVYAWIDDQKPTWLGGLVCGPGSPMIPLTRARLPKQYELRDYPDITHLVRCEYPGLWIDPAIAFTLGREGPNPRPLFYRRVHNELAPYTNGFVSYSDGVHDDVNKVVWSALGWNSSADLNQILTQYCRVFFGPDVAKEAAAGIFAFERTYKGPLSTNGGVDANLDLWQKLDHQHPSLDGNWRWQLCMLRANYDAYTRHRLIYESKLEDEANACLLKAPKVGADKAMDNALAVLARADHHIRPKLHKRIVDLCAALYKSIGLQTSVAKYGASGEERGAILDFLDFPLNNRWWLEDQFALVRKMATEQEKCARLKTIADWEHPGPGSFYDDIGNIEKCPHVVRGPDLSGGPLLPALAKGDISIPGFSWWKDGASRARLSWLTNQWPVAMYYSALDPGANYVLRTTGNRDCFPLVNGVALKPTRYGKKIGEIKEFPIPKKLYASGAITVKFRIPSEPNLGWRDQSSLTEVWLIKKRSGTRVAKQGR